MGLAVKGGSKVLVGVRVAVSVGVGVRVGVDVRVEVGETVCVTLGVIDSVEADVNVRDGVNVIVDVGVRAAIAMPFMMSLPAPARITTPNATPKIPPTRRLLSLGKDIFHSTIIGSGFKLLSLVNKGEKYFCGDQGSRGLLITFSSCIPAGVVGKSDPNPRALNA